MVAWQFLPPLIKSRKFCLFQLIRNKNVASFTENVEILTYCINTPEKCVIKKSIDFCMGQPDCSYPGETLNVQTAVLVLRSSVRFVTIDEFFLKKVFFIYNFLKIKPYKV